MLINILNSDNSNIDYIKTQHCQIMTTIAYRILQFEFMIKNDSGKPYILHCYYFWDNQFLRLYQLSCNTAFVIFNLRKDFQQDNLSFVCLQFYRQNCLNILAGNTCFHIQAKDQ